MKKVLVLDDEQDILDIWFEQFRFWGLNVEVHTAKNGQDGLKLLQAVNEYDLIIADYKMPVMNGLDFIRALRTYPKFSEIPVFFFSGFAPELKSHMDKLDNVMLFEKPFISEKMKIHIRMCLSKEEPQEPAMSHSELLRA